jgi:hypothetical protein
MGAIVKRLIFATAAAALFCSFQASASSFPSPPLYPSFSVPAASTLITTFKVTHSTTTVPAAINAEGEITGLYWDSEGESHGFVRNAGGTIAKFSVPGANRVGTQPTGINKNGVIAGLWGSTSGSEYLVHGFVRAANGTITSFDFAGTLGGKVCGIDSAGDVAGYYDTDRGNSSAGFIRAHGGAITKFQVGSQTTCASISAKGVIVGNFYGKNQTMGFMRAPDGTITKFHAGTRETDPANINTAGVIAGTYYDDSDNQQGFERAPDGTITTIQVPGAIQTIIDAINDKGAVIGTYEDSSEKFHSFMRAANGTVTTFAVAKSVFTSPAAINSDGQVTGLYEDKNSNRWAFLRTPAP